MRSLSSIAGKLRGAAGGGGKHRGVGKLRALERRHERGVFAGRANGFERVARRFRRDARDLA